MMVMASSAPIRVSTVMTHHCHQVNPVSLAWARCASTGYCSAAFRLARRAMSGPTTNPKGPVRSRALEYHQKNLSLGGHQLAPDGCGLVKRRRGRVRAPFH